MVETRGQQASRESEKTSGKSEPQPAQVSSSEGLTKEEPKREPPSLEPELGTALAIVVPFMAILLGVFAHKLGLITIPGIDPWLDAFIGGIRKPQPRTKKALWGE